MDANAAAACGAALVSCTTVCGESGALLPVADIVREVKRSRPDALVHTDAAQGFLRVDCGVARSGVDMLSVSAHKIGGVRGAGALYVRNGIKLKPLWGGGGQENGLRPGTEPLPAIAAFAAAVGAWKPEYEAHMRGLTDYARAELERRGAYIVTPKAARAPHILTFCPPQGKAGGSWRSGVPAQVTVRRLSDAGVYISAGAACGRGRVPEALKALRLPPGAAERAVRLSVGPGNTRADIDALVDAIDGA
ncbi:MAG: aminotransferase class V-fold PLP-dependent enzyme [Oscillospiraceae bacterium]|nr:aminotransferase class V-fold PLP-dependent enzyme [Oscillospiraceae bacterium]